MTVNIEMPGGMPAGSVVITPTQMYSELRTVSEQVQHLAAIIDPALTDIRDDVASVRTLVTSDHEPRIRSLEKRLLLATGIAMAGGAGLSKLLPLIGG